MSATSFLFNGTPPADINTTSAESATLPTWYQEYLQGLMGTANALAATPYPQYGGPLIAPFNDTQNQAFSMTGALPGQTSGALGNASTALGAAGNINIPGAVQPYINASTSNANNPSAALQPYNDQASSYLNTAAQYNPAAATQPYLNNASNLTNASTAFNPAAATQPYQNNASGYAQQATNTLTPGGIQNYLNPYTQDVVQNMQQLANQNWNNTILPSVQNEFVSAGQFGSGRNAQILGQAANTFQNNLEGQEANALAAGYNTAGTLAGQQANILGNAASTSLGQGSLANTATGSEAGILQGAAGQQGALGTAAGNAAGSTAGIYGALGNTALSQGTAAGAAAGQEAGIQQQAGALSDQAAAQQGALQTGVGTANTALANTQQNIGLQNAAAEQTVGNQQQAQTQNNLSTAYNQFQQQAQYPEQQTAFLSDIIRGLQPPASTSVNSNQAPSPFSTTSPSIGNTLSALFGSGTGNKEGGLIQGYAKGGKVSGGAGMMAGHPPGVEKHLANGIIQHANGDITIPFKVLQQIGTKLSQLPQFQKVLSGHGAVGQPPQTGPAPAPMATSPSPPMAPQGALAGGPPQMPMRGALSRG